MSRKDPRPDPKVTIGPLVDLFSTLAFSSPLTLRHLASPTPSPMLTQRVPRNLFPDGDPKNGPNYEKKCFFPSKRSTERPRNSFFIGSQKSSASLESGLARKTETGEAGGAVGGALSTDLEGDNQHRRDARAGKAERMVGVIQTQAGGLSCVRRIDQTSRRDQFSMTSDHRSCITFQ